MAFVKAEADQQVVPAGATEVIGTFQGLGSTVDKIVGIFWADKAGELTVEYSGDGTNYDFVELTAVVASTGVKVISEVVAPYVRIRFKNTAGTDTTAVRGEFRTSSSGPR